MVPPRAPPSERDEHRPRRSRAADLSARRRDVRARRGRLARRRRRASATSTSWPGSPSAGSATAIPAVTAATHAQLDRLWHVSNLFWTQPMAELADTALAIASAARRRSSATRARRRSRPASSTRARRPARPGIVALENSFHGRTLRRPVGHGPAGEARRVRAARPRRPLRAAERRRVAGGRRRRRQRRLHPPRADPGRGRHQPGDASLPRISGRRSPRRPGPALLRRGPVRPRAHGHVLRARAARRSSRSSSRWRRASPTACRSVPPRGRRGRGRLRRPATTPRRSAATRSRAPRRAPCSTRSTTSCSSTCAPIGARLAGGLALAARRARRCAGAGLLIGAELDRPAAPVVTACLEAGLVVGLGGRARCSA